MQRSALRSLITSLWLCSFAVLCLPNLGALEDFSIIQAVFIPPVYHVGDHVEYRIQFKTPLGASMLVPNAVPTTPWGSIQSINLESREDFYELRIQFMAFEPGTHTFPAIDFGTLSMDNLSLYVTPVLDATMKDPAGHRPQMLIPGTVLMLVLQLLIVAALVFMLIVVRRKGFVWLVQLHKRWLTGRPFRRIRDSMAVLIREIDELPDRAFYITLMEEIRTYLSDRLNIPAISATTQEIERWLTQKATPSEFSEGIIAMCRDGDYVKFGKASMSRESKLFHVSSLIRILYNLEQYLKRLPQDFDRLASQTQDEQYADI